MSAIEWTILSLELTVTTKAITSLLKLAHSSVAVVLNYPRLHLIAVSNASLMKGLRRGQHPLGTEAAFQSFAFIEWSDYRRPC